MKGALAILGVFLLMAAGVVVLATALGYLPALSDKIKLGEPRDLGVEYTEADYLSAQSKLEAQVAATEPQTFTEAEITALLNACGSTSCALHDVQVKTRDDGRFEFSGLIDKSELLEFAASHDLDITLDQSLTLLPERPSFYAVVAASGRDDTLSLTLDEASVAGITLPDDVREDLGVEIMAQLNAYLRSQPGTQLENLQVLPEGVKLEGSVH